MIIEALVDGVIVFRTGTVTGVMAGRKGDLSPAFILDTEDAAGIERVLNYRIGTRRIDIPIWFKASNRDAVLNTIQNLLTVLAPGNVTLRFTSPTQRIRQLQGCYLTSGGQDDGFDGLDDLGGAQAVLTFICPDPYWYNPTITTVPFVPTVSTGVFFPFFPLRLSANPTLQRQTVDNLGITAWPVWTITGPGSNITIIDYTTSKFIQWTGALIAGDILIIDTTPMVKTIELNGASSYAYLVKTSELFPLEFGNNDIAIMMEDIDNALTVASLTYYTRYISL